MNAGGSDVAVGSEVAGYRIEELVGRGGMGAVYRAREAGLDDYRVVVNVGPGGGQTIFHLHWHVLGGRISGMPA